MPGHEHNQGRSQSERQKRRSSHREGLCEGKRLEQPPLLSLQREYRKKTDSDHQKGEKERFAQLFASGDHNLPPLCRPQTGWGVLQTLVHILHHHDSLIREHPDRNRNARQ